MTEILWNHVGRRIEIGGGGGGGAVREALAVPPAKKAWSGHNHCLFALKADNFDTQTKTVGTLIAHHVFNLSPLKIRSLLSSIGIYCSGPPNWIYSPLDVSSSVTGQPQLNNRWSTNTVTCSETLNLPVFYSSADLVSEFKHCGFRKALYI